MKEFINSLIKPLLYEQDTKSVGIFGGSFKPPTKGHLEVVQTALQQYPNLDEFYIVVGSGIRDGITQEESLRIWEIYKKFLPSNVKVITAKSPFTWIKDYIKANPTQDITVFVGTREGSEEDIQDFQQRKDFVERYSDTLEVVNIITQGSISGTKARQAAKISPEELYKYLPDELTYSNRLEIFNLVRGVVHESFIPDQYFDKIEYYTQYYRNLTPSNISVERIGDKIEISGVQQPLMENATYSSNIDIKQEIAKLTKHMLDQGKNILPLPKLVLRNGDKENAGKFLGKTAYYDPNSMEIVLYTEGRHPKDIVRSYAHEMVHHIQNLEDRLGNIATTNTTEDDHLDRIEQEAYLDGNMTFRNWTDSLQEGKQVGPLYHYTSADGLKGIIQSNRINASEENYLGNELYYVSFTRNKNFHNKGQNFNVKTDYRITLDGDKLSNRYKIKPFAYIPGWDYTDNWEYDWLEDEPENVARDFFNGTGDYDEQEERISFKGGNGGIDNIKNYILAVDKVEDLQEKKNKDPFGLNQYARELAQGLEEQLVMEGRYDALAAQLTRISINLVKNAYKKSGATKNGTYLGKKIYYREGENVPNIVDNDQKSILFLQIPDDLPTPLKSTPPLTFYYTLKVQFVEGLDGYNYGADAFSDEDNSIIEVRLEIDPKNIPSSLNDIYMDVIDAIRHEIEHFTQGGENVIASKTLPSDMSIRQKIQTGELPAKEYFLLKKEIPAMLQGLYLKAKKSKQPFNQVVDSYLDRWKSIKDENGNPYITEEDKQEILKTWRTYLPSLSLPQI